MTNSLHSNDKKPMIHSTSINIMKADCLFLLILIFPKDMLMTLKLPFQNKRSRMH